MKNILMAALAMVVIIAVQMILSQICDWHTAEVFSKVSCTALFYYAIIKCVQKRTVKS